jgi:hypothetical protein
MDHNYDAISGDKVKGRRNEPEALRVVFLGPSCFPVQALAANVLPHPGGECKSASGAGSGLGRFAHSLEIPSSALIALTKKNPC